MESRYNPWGVTVPPPTESAFFNAARRTVFLLVEGHSDELFWLARVDRHRCQVRAMGGRAEALRELDTAGSEGKGGFVAVLDADFDRIEGRLAQHPNVIWTDLHDLELILIASPALDKVLIEIASRKKLDDFAASTPVREALLARAAVLAQLRRLSLREGLNLSFRRATKEGFKYLPYHDFCPRSSWELDPVQLVRAVLDFSQRHDLRPADLLARLDTTEVDRWQLCVGHDVVGLLVVGLRSKLGSENFSIEGIQKDLRVAFEWQHLEQTGMYRDLRVWEARNAPHRIFAATASSREP